MDHKIITVLFTIFCGKPVLGRWRWAWMTVDMIFWWPRGFIYSQNIFLPRHCYRKQCIQLSGSLHGINFSIRVGWTFDAVAPAHADKIIALASVALGKKLGGLGRANSALGFANVSRGCPANKRTSITALLGGVQMIGMTVAPLFSACLASADFFATWCTFWQSQYSLVDYNHHQFRQWQNGVKLSSI